MVCTGKPAVTDRERLEAVCNSTVAACMRRNRPTLPPYFGTPSPEAIKRERNNIIVSFLYLGLIYWNFGLIFRNAWRERPGIKKEFQIQLKCELYWMEKFMKKICSFEIMQSLNQFIIKL